MQLQRFDQSCIEESHKKKRIKKIVSKYFGNIEMDETQRSEAVEALSQCQTTAEVNGALATVGLPAHSVNTIREQLYDMYGVNHGDRGFSTCDVESVSQEESLREYSAPGSLKGSHCGEETPGVETLSET